MKVAIASMLNPMRGAALSPKGVAQTANVLQKGQGPRRDSVSISGEGKQNAGGGDSTLKMLMEQKDYLSQARDKLLKQSGGSDGEKEFIKGKIKELTKQLAAVDQQMADYLLKKQEEALGTDKDKVSTKGKTKDELRQMQMETVAKATDDLATMDTLRRTRAELTRSAAWEQEALENPLSLSSGGIEGEMAAASARLGKMEAGIAGLKEAEDDLLAEAEALAEKAAELGMAAAEAEESALEKATTPEETLSAEEAAKSGAPEKPEEVQKPDQEQASEEAEAEKEDTM